MLVYVQQFEETFVRDQMERLDNAMAMSISKAKVDVVTLRRRDEELKQLLANVREYTDPQELTAQMVNDLVDKIIVHAPDKSSGHRKQKIEIYYNAVGIIDFPTVNEDDCIALHGRCKGKKIAA